MILQIKKPNKPTETIEPNENINRQAQIDAVELTVLIHNRDNPTDLWTVEKIETDKPSNNSTQ